MDPQTITVRLPSPHPGQLDVLRDESRFQVLSCGRRWGKTTCGLLYLVPAAFGQAKDASGIPYKRGMPVGFFSPTYKFLDDAWRTTLHTLGGSVTRSDKTERRIEVVGGGAIDFWTMDSPDPGRGRKYARVYVDEGGLQSNVVEIWNAAIRPTLTDYAGRAMFGGTPKGMGGLMELYAKGEQGIRSWRSWRCKTIDNTTLPGIVEEVESARLDMPPEIFAQEYEGMPASDAGNPFGLSSIDACTGLLSDAAPIVFGVDVAVEHDYTVVVGLDKDGNVCRFERWNGGTWEATQDRITNLVGRTRTIIDATGVGAPIAERIAKHNANMVPFKFTSESKQRIMERLALQIQTRKVRFPDGPIPNELKQFQYHYSRSGTIVRVKYGAPNGLYDDSVCALALAVEGYASRPSAVCSVLSSEGKQWRNDLTAQERILLGQTSSRPARRLPL